MQQTQLLNYYSAEFLKFQFHQVILRKIKIINLLFLSLLCFTFLLWISDATDSKSAISCLCIHKTSFCSSSIKSFVCVHKNWFAFLLQPAPKVGPWMLNKITYCLPECYSAITAHSRICFEKNSFVSVTHSLRSFVTLTNSFFSKQTLEHAVMTSKYTGKQ